MIFSQQQRNSSPGRKVLVRDSETPLTDRYAKVLTSPPPGLTILIESGVPRPDFGRPGASRDCCTALTKALKPEHR